MWREERPSARRAHHVSGQDELHDSMRTCSHPCFSWGLTIRVSYRHSQRASVVDRGRQGDRERDPRPGSI